MAAILLVARHSPPPPHSTTMQHHHHHYAAPLPPPPRSNRRWLSLLWCSFCKQGRVLMEQEQHQQALESFRAAISFNGCDEEAVLLLVKLLKDRGSTQEAIEAATAYRCHTALAARNGGWSHS